MFRNIRLYRLPADWEFDLDHAQSGLASNAFKPCGPYEASRSGWVPPVAADVEQPLMFLSHHHHHLFRLREQERVLPGAAVSEVLDERIADFEGRYERKPGRKERADLKDAVLNELMPKTLVKSRYSWGFVNLEDRLLVVDASTPNRAEHFIDRLRDALGSLAVTPVAYNQGVSTLLTRILMHETDAIWQAGDSAFLRDPAAGATEVRYRNADLHDRTVERQIKSGLKVAALEIVWDNAIRCVLAEDGGMSRVKLDDVNSDDDAEELAPDERLQAEFTLLSLTLARYLGALAKALDGYAD